MGSAEPLRGEIIRFVLTRAEGNGDFLTRAELNFPMPGGGSLPLIDMMRGIRNPREMDATITVMSAIGGAYDDGEIDGGLFRYSYRRGSLDGDNAKLRRALELDLPLVLLRKTPDGRFIPHAPVWVVEDRQSERAFLIALDQELRTLAEQPASEPLRRYSETMAKRRLHQKDFRGSVISAYRTRCAICQLNHGELLDAAHIVPDSEEMGLPVVPNGLSLCKIHHAAYDQNMLGISPDYEVRIDHKLLLEVDGPMLRHGLQDMHGSKLIVPPRRADQPDRDRLAQRFAQFVQHAS